MTTMRIDGELVGFGSLSRSYPFQDLARLLRRPYGTVLRAADMIDRWPLRSFGVAYASDQIPEQMLRAHYLRVANTVGELSADEVGAVYRVCAAPWRWEFPPQGRGL